ncbi:MAG: helix-turn-helix domain-containing protein [Acidimicrobiaceae bacterium]|nr:helix-turn-helix domain-containing protein [Acidimicrobiaceae bacterium]
MADGAADDLELLGRLMAEFRALQADQGRVRARMVDAAGRLARSGVTVTAIADAAGVSRPTVYGWINAGG